MVKGKGTETVSLQCVDLYTGCCHCKEDVVLALNKLMSFPVQDLTVEQKGNNAGLKADNCCDEKI